MPSALAAGRFDEVTAIDNALDTRISVHHGSNS